MPRSSGSPRISAIDFGVLAQPRELEAEARLGFVLRGDARHERAADIDREARHQDAVEERGDRHVGRDRHPGPEDLERDRAADRPEDADEGDEGEERVQEIDREIDHRLGREPALVGDAVLGVRRLDLGEVEPVVALAPKPQAGEAVHQPFAPAHLQRLAGDDDEHADAGDHHHQPGECEDRPAKRRAVAALERVEEDAVPLVDREVQADVADDQRGERDGQEPGPPRGRTPPPARDEAAELPRHLPVVGEVARIVRKRGDAHGPERRLRAQSHPRGQRLNIG